MRIFYLRFFSFKREFFSHFNADLHILLAHQPKYLNINSNISVDLAICGHTHAGQIFPFNYLVKMDQKYVYGYYKKDNMQIYVSSGVGFWGMPMRIFSVGEIIHLRLN